MEPARLKKKVLFICQHNSSRSQMAAGFLNAYFGERYEAYCAGIKPAAINPYTIKVMKEAGIDISKHCAKNIKEFRGMEFDCIITLCDYTKKACTDLPECKKLLHKGFKHPCDFKGSPEEILRIFRCIREEIFDWVEKEAVF